MAIFCVNTRSKKFLEALKRLNLSSGTLEVIVYEYINKEQNPDLFPSDDYIKSQLEKDYIVSAEDYNDVHTLWTNLVESQEAITSDLESALKKVTTFLDYFPEKHIHIIKVNDSDGSYVVRVDEPKKAVIKANTDETNDIGESVAEGDDVDMSTVTGGKNLTALLKAAKKLSVNAKNVGKKPATSTKPTTTTTKTTQENALTTFTSVMKLLNSLITFFGRTHRYTVNGKLNDYSVTGFYDFINGKSEETSDENVALKIGNTHDAMLRDFFSNKGLQRTYPNMTEEMVLDFAKEAQKFKEALVSKYGEDFIAITDEKLLRLAANVEYDGQSYLVAGTIDMIVIDDKGNIHIIDFKTKRDNNTTKFYDEDKYRFQISLYQAILSQYMNLGNSQVRIARFDVSYPPADEVDYVYKNDEVFDENGTHIYDMVDNNGNLLYNPGIFAGERSLMDIGTEGLTDLKIEPIKSFNQRKKEAQKAYGVTEPVAVKNSTSTSLTINITTKEKNEFSPLSNLTESKITINGNEFNSVENYFQWRKAILVADYWKKQGNDEQAKKAYAIANKIKSGTPWQAWGLAAAGSKNRALDMPKSVQELWDKLLKRVMKTAIKARLEQHPEDKALLLSTGNALLTHRFNSKQTKDSGPFAEVLMELRKEYGGEGKPSILQTTTKTTSTTTTDSPITLSDDAITRQVMEHLNSLWESMGLKVFDSAGMKRFLEKHPGVIDLVQEFANSENNSNFENNLNNKENDLRSRNRLILLLRFSHEELKGSNGNLEEAEALLMGRDESSVPEKQESVTGSEELAEKQVKILEKWAKENNIWIDNTDKVLTDKYGEPFASEGEATVYRKNNNTVVKAITMAYYIEPHLMLDRVVLHNSISPGAAMKLINIGRNENGEFVVVIELPFIEGTQPTQDEIVSYMASLGFKPYKNNTEFKNDETDILAMDLHDENVIKNKNGEFVIIDGDFRINTKNFNLGGKRTTKGDSNQFKEDLQTFTTPSGEIYGFVDKEGNIYLDETKIEPKHPMHEYTHVWDRMVKDRNPELWNRGVELMKAGVPTLWSLVEQDANYGKKWKAQGKSEEEYTFLVASEVHSRLVGDKGEELLNERAKEEGEKGIIAKLKKWILDVWEYLKETFSNWTLEELDKLGIDDFNKMTIRDFVLGTNLTDTSTEKLSLTTEQAEERLNNFNTLEKQSTELVDSTRDSFIGNYISLELSPEAKEGYTGVYTLRINDGVKESLNETSMLELWKELRSLIEQLPWSSQITLDTETFDEIDLMMLDNLLGYKHLYANETGKTEISFYEQSNMAVAAEEISKLNKRINYNKDNSTLTVPVFTTGFSKEDIDRRTLYNRLMDSTLVKPQELRRLAKAAIYKMSEIITHLLAYANGKETYGVDSDLDFTLMTRLEIINNFKRMASDDKYTTGLYGLLVLVRDRMFDSKVRPADTSFDVLDVLDLIHDNWDAFIELGYDTIIATEEIAFDGNTQIKTDLDNSIDERELELVEEITGGELESWQVNFRSVSAVASLSRQLKTALGSLYLYDQNGNIIKDKYDFEYRLNVQEAVTKILKFTQGAQSLDDKNDDGTYKDSSMIYMLQKHLDSNPWLLLLINMLTDTIDNKGNTVKADEQFKAQFYSNFKKFFQRYAIVFRNKDTGALQTKIINENEEAENILAECKTREYNFAVGGFTLRNTDGTINKKALASLEAAYNKLVKLSEKILITKGKIADIVDLGEYHKVLRNIFDILDIEIPETFSFNKIFDIKTNVKTLTTKLNFLLNGINGIIGNDKEITSKITKFREYKLIVDIIGKYTGQNIESVSYQNGKLIYSYVLPSYINRLVDKLKGEKGVFSKEEFDKFIGDDYLQYEWFFKDGKIRCSWLRKLINSPVARDTIQHTVVLSYKDTHNNDISYQDKSPAMLMASMVKMFYYGAKDNPYGYFRIPLESNKPSEEYIRFLKVGTGYRDIITEEMWDIFMQETDRIKASIAREGLSKDLKIKSKGKKPTFDGKRGRSFVIADYLLKYYDGSYKERVQYKEMKKKAEDASLSETERQLASLWVSQEDVFHKLVNDFISNPKMSDTDLMSLIELHKVITQRGMDEKYDEAREAWVKEGFIVETTDEKTGKTTVSFYDNVISSEAELRRFFWEDFFASTQILELSITDPALYTDAEDLQKRLAQIHAPGVQPNIKVRDKDGRLYTDGTARFLFILDDIVKSSGLENIKKIHSEVLDETPDSKKAEVLKKIDFIIETFEDINFADAQGYSCPTSYRKKMAIFGKWDDRMEDAYQKLIHPELYPDVDVAELLDVLWQPLKPFVYGQVKRPGDNDFLPDLKVGVQVKDSEFVLVMADALARRYGKPNKLSAIYDFMEASQKDEDGNINGKGFDTVVFMSAVNTGSMGIIDLNDEKDSNGNVIRELTEEEVKERLNQAYLDDGSYNPYYVTEVPFEDYVIQQEVPAHFKNHEQAQGSQDRILCWADILDRDSKGNENTLVIDGKTITVAKAKENYFDAIAENISQSAKELTDRFELNNPDKRIRNKALSKILTDTILKDSRFGPDVLWACSLNEFGEFNIPLSDPVQANRILQLLNSIIKNTINKQEIAGGPVVQVSGWGKSEDLNIRFKTTDNKLLLTEKEFNGGIRPRGYSTDKWKSPEGFESYLDYIEDLQGVAYFECYAPIFDDTIAEDFTRTDENGELYIDVEAMERTNPKLLEMFGYRIPTESKYSMIPMKIVGFLPRQAGEGLMLPADITALAGSDFDIDKDYIMRYSFIRYVDKDGNIIYKNPEEGRAYRNNLIISTQFAILQAKLTLPLLFTPGNFEEPKKFSYLMSAIQELARITGKSSSVLYEQLKNKDTDELKDISIKSSNLAFSHTHMLFHKQNMVAGKLIGVFAQANVSHAFLGLVKGTSISIEDEEAFELCGEPIKGNFIIDDVMNLKGDTTISSTLAALLAASVDAVKDPILNLINVNIDTVNVVVTLVRMGFDMGTVALLIGQPIIRQIVTKTNSTNKSLSTILDNTIDLLEGDLGVIDKISIGKDTLIDNITEQSPLANYMILLIMRRALSISDKFRSITHMTRYNSITSAVGPFAADTELSRMKDEAFDKSVAAGGMSAEVVMAVNNPILKAFRQSSYDIEERLLGENLIQAERSFHNSLRNLATTLGYDQGGMDSSIANAFSDFYMAFFVNSQTNGESVFDLDKDHREKIIEEFPIVFNALKPRIKDNALVAAINLVKRETEAYESLELKIRGRSSDIIEDYKKAWQELYKNEDTRKLALLLAEYCFFKGTFGFSPKTFMLLLPNEIKTHLKGYVRTLSDKTLSNITGNCVIQDRCVRQFILHHPELIKVNCSFPINDFEPEYTEDSTYGTCIMVNIERTENNPKRKNREPYRLPVYKKFLTIQNEPYFVVSINDKQGVAKLKKVSFLGNSGESIEIDPDVDFPETMYSAEQIAATSRKGNDNAKLTRQLREDIVKEFLRNLYNVDELNVLFSKNPIQATSDIQKKSENSESVITKAMSTAEIRDVMIRLLKKNKEINNPVLLIQEAKEDEDKTNLCE